MERFPSSDYDKNVDYSGTSMGTEISNVYLLVRLQEELNKKKTLEEKVYFLVGHAPTSLPTNYYYDNNVIGKVFLEKLFSIYDSNPELVVKILREYSGNAVYKKDFVKDSDKIGPITVLCELGVCEETEKEFINEYLRDQGCGSSTVEN